MLFWDVDIQKTFSSLVDVCIFLASRRSSRICTSCPFGQVLIRFRSSHQHVLIGLATPNCKFMDHTDPGRQPIGAPLKPAFVRVPVRENRGKGEARGGVSGGKRFAPSQNSLRKAAYEFDLI
jgi:hypothetical protein